MKKVSVIVPIYNEGDEFKIFLNELYTHLKKQSYEFEIIILDSLTTNNSYEVVKEFSSKHNEVNGYYMRHPGVAVVDKTNKYMYGFQVAKGDYIITMDGDGQDRPEDMPEFLNKLENGMDFVIGYKHKRKDGFAYMLTSKLANTLIRKLTGVTVHDMNNGYKGFTRQIAKSLKLRSGHFRFIPVIASANKWKIDEVKVNHRAREFGTGKFSFMSRLQGGLFDMFVVYVITKMGDTPMYTLGWLSVALFLIGLASLLLSIFIKSIFAYLLGFGFITILLSTEIFIAGILLEYFRGMVDSKDYSNLVIEKI